MHRLRHGDHGPAVAEIRGTLTKLGYLHHGTSGIRRESADGAHWVAPDAIFDHQLDSAVRAFQQQRGLLVDGIVGPATYRSLREASYRLGARTLIYQLSAPLYGDDVAALQAKLQDLGFYAGRVDGFFGPQTHESLSSFQREIGIAADGICGPQTLRSLELLGTRVTGGSPHAISEEELVRRKGPQLGGKRIVIDPGLGGPSTGTIVNGISEADILWDLAMRLEGRMAATGMETFLSRPHNADPSEAERALTSNAFDADLMISLRCDSNSSPSANGRRELPLRKFARFGLDDRAGVDRFRSARDRCANSVAGLQNSRSNVGVVAPDQHADGTDRSRLPVQRVRRCGTDESADA